METQMHITIILAIINIALLLWILISNALSYKKFKAEYTLFTIIFAGVFLLQYVVGAYFYFTNMELYPSMIATQLMVLTLIQTAAFGYMLWMALQ